MKTALENSVPTELFDVYETVIASIRSCNDDSIELAQKILSWICHAKRPLKMPELREAIAIRKTDIDLAEDDLMEPGDIVELCGSLISYDRASQVVSLSHETIHEFLKGRYSEFIMPQSEIAKLCLTYLLFETFSSGRCQDETSYGERIAARPLGQYAARYWGAHIKGECELESEIHALLSKIVASSRPEVIRQLEYGEAAEQWDAGTSDGGATLLHLCAKHDLYVLAREILDPKEYTVINSKMDTLHTEETGRRAAEMLSAKTDSGFTPLHFAVIFGHMNLVDLFLVHNAEVDTKATSRWCSGWSALHIAVMSNQFEVIRRLLLAGADISVKDDYDDNTPLHLASSGGHEKMVQLLLNENAKIYPVTKNGDTPLHYAANNGHVATVRTLVHAEADAKAANNRGWTALHYAACGGHVSTVELLLLHGVEAATMTTSNNTALHFAAQKGHAEVVHALLEYVERAYLLEGFEQVGQS